MATKRRGHGDTSDFWSGLASPARLLTQPLEHKAPAQRVGGEVIQTQPGATIRLLFGLLFMFFFFKKHFSHSPDDATASQSCAQVKIPIPEPIRKGRQE